MNVLTFIGIMALLLSMIPISILLIYAVNIGYTVINRTYKDTIAFSEAELIPIPLEIPTEEDEWAKSNGFEYIGSYKMSLPIANNHIWAWRRTDRPTFFCRYLIQVKNDSKVAHELVTDFANNVSLSTADTNFANSQPHRGGSYVQGFTGISLDEEWNLHIEAENYLIDKGAAKLEAKDANFENDFIKDIRRHANYIQSLPLWPLRGIYWYFIRRRLYSNKSIRVQHEKGMTRLPNELKKDKAA
jgi:hypothetical protein